MTREAFKAVLNVANAEHPENPLLMPGWPHLTEWRCTACGTGVTIAAAKFREWCPNCAEPLRLVTPHDHTLQMNQVAAEH